eukprot:718557-Pelagomonas_calceolata.AAC.4
MLATRPSKVDEEQYHLIRQQSVLVEPVKTSRSTREEQRDACMVLECGSPDCNIGCTCCQLG